MEDEAAKSAISSRNGRLNEFRLQNSRPDTAKNKT